MTKLRLENINFSFGNEKAIQNFSLNVEEGSFTTLLGPSGCGKTTLLRLISGFLEPAAGRILIDGKDQKGIEVNERKIALVFQDYALFPHMTVYENLLYGLKIQSKQNKKNGKPPLTNSYIQDMIQKIAGDLGIKPLLERYPHQLSGGQQQRVALGRALVLKPSILLMDEPLSSLDTKLRNKVREELREIQQQLKITTIYVTHDQEEALSLSTRIAVLNKGQLLQEGTPEEIYFEPKDTFTADFVGKASFLKKNGSVIMVRPEWFELLSKSTDQSIFPQSAAVSVPALSTEIIISGTVYSSSFLGSKTRFLIQSDDGTEIISNSDSADSQVQTGAELNSQNLIAADFDTLETRHIKPGDRIVIRAKKIWQLP